MEIKISVVMPVHNTPIDILRECLTSALNQSFDDYELICVDDGSESYIQEELESLKNKYSNLKVIRLEKSIGAARARNTGFEHTQGEYVIFLDSDDVFDLKLLEKMYASAVENDSELVVCGYKTMKGNVFDNYKLKYDELFLVRLPLVPWTYLVKKEELKREKILFQDLSSSNDFYYSMMVIMKSKKISIVNEALITYRLGVPNQISNHRNSMNLYYAVEKVLSDLSDEEIRKYDKMIDIVIVAGVISEISRCKDEKTNAKMYKLFQEYFRNKDTTFENASFEARRKRLISKDYDTRWFETIEDFDEQLKDETENLVAALRGKNIVLWGIGKRGEAFLNWAKKEEKINVAAVYDKSVENSVENIYGIPIIEIKDIARLEDEILVASNTAIYNYIASHEIYDLKNVLDLQLYCPLQNSIKELRE